MHRRNRSRAARLAAWGLGFMVAAAVGAPALAADPPAPIERGPANVKAVAFACNVVWGTEHVLPIARAFKAAGGKATFFLGGQWAARHPAEAKELAAMGMEIASHGDAHRHVASMSLEGNLEEIDRANRSIEAATGMRPRLYAPAYGEVNGIVRRAAQMRGMPVVMWSIDTIDWRTWHTPDIIRSRVLTRLSPGAIVLIHPTDRTLAALPGLLSAIRAQGYRVETVSDLLHGEGPASASRAKAAASRSAHAPAAGRRNVAQGREA